ncbi:MAG: hypothetical protein LBJ18_00545 [Rickettsiales bacterium]|nr:hypothetical protein [Rickettsiales bacterium]
MFVIPTKVGIHCVADLNAKRIVANVFAGAKIKACGAVDPGLRRDDGSDEPFMNNG